LLVADDFAAAAKRISGRVHRTPTASATRLGEQVGARLFLKQELFQRTGSFKIRGMFNRLLTLSAQEREPGLISISAGNAAAALAYAAGELGTRATIVMPATAMPAKIEATRGYGGEVVLTEEGLLDTCNALGEERGLKFVHPFDDLEVMAGHGTIALEILEERPDVAALIVPIGGGGLCGGVAAAAKQQRGDLLVYGVEPVGADAMTRSLACGEPVHLDGLDTIADGLAAPFAGKHTLEHVRKYVDRVVTVDDAAIIDAMRWIMTRAKLAVEPSGAAAYAALLSGAITPPAGGEVVCLISGGNVDRDLLRRLI